MKITDGNRTVKITIREFDGTSLGQDFSSDYFADVHLCPYDEEKEAYIVKDVDYCIDMANSTGPEGARCIINADGEAVLDENIIVSVDEI